MSKYGHQARKMAVKFSIEGVGKILIGNPLELGIQRHCQGRILLLKDTSAAFSGHYIIFVGKWTLRSKLLQTCFKNKTFLKYSVSLSNALFFF